MILFMEAVRSAGHVRLILFKVFFVESFVALIRAIGLLVSGYKADERGVVCPHYHGYEQDEEYDCCDLPFSLFCLVRHFFELFDFWMTFR